MFGQIVLGNQMLGALPPVVDSVVLSTDALVPSETVSAGVAYSSSFSDTLILADTLGLEFLENVSDTLSDTSTFNEIQPLTDTLTGSETLATIINAKCVLSDTLTASETRATSIDPYDLYSDVLVTVDTFEQDLFRLSDTLTSTETFFSGNIDRVPLTETLTFTEAWKSDVSNYLDTLTSSDSFSSNKFEYVTSSDTLAPTENWDGRVGDIVDSLAATESFAALGPIYANISDSLVPIESLITTGSQSVDFSDLMSCYEQTVSGEQDAFTDSLAETETWTQHEPTDLLVEVETFDSYISYGYVDALEPVESLSADGTLQSVAVSDNLTPVEGWVDVVITSTIHREYRPSGNSSIPTTQPVLSCSDTVTFEYPTSSPTITLTLKRPTLNDRHGYFAQRIVRSSRAGTLRVGSDPSWPKYDTLNIQFVALTKADKEAFLSLFTNALGKTVRYTDYESREWDVVLTDPQIVENHRTCGFDISVQLEGALA